MPATNIEWTDRAWPILNGCRRVSPGCENCWAELLTATRLRHHPRYKGLALYTEHGPRWTGERRFATELLEEPLRARKPLRWFVANKGDLLSDEVTDEEIAASFVFMAAAGKQTFQVLTKRARSLATRIPASPSDAKDWLQRGLDSLPDDLKRTAYAALTCQAVSPGALPPWPLRNVWMGMTVEDQPRADERLEHLGVLADAGWLTWCSYEPALGPVNFRPWIKFIRWIVFGGESGRDARPCAMEWALDAYQACRIAGAAFFFKQGGENAYVENSNLWPAMDDGIDFERMPPAPAGVTAVAAHGLPLTGKGGDLNEVGLYCPEVCIREWPEVARGA